MNRWLLAKTFPLFVANPGNSPAITRDLRLELNDFISSSTRHRINQNFLKDSK